MSKHILLIVNKKGCGWCTYFKGEKLDSLKNEFSETLEIKEMDILELFTALEGNSKLGALVDGIKAFPHLQLVTRESWEDSCSKLKLSGVYSDSEIFKGPNPKTPYTPFYILKWAYSERDFEYSNSDGKRKRNIV